MCENSKASMMLIPEQLAALRAVPNSPRFTFHLDGCMAHAIVSHIEAQAQQLNTQRIMIEAQLAVKGRIRDEASKRGRDASSAVSELDYLIELIDAQQARVAELEKDVMRYRKLRSWHWSESDFCVVANPIENVKLGVMCPSGQVLDGLLDLYLEEDKN